MRFLRHTEGNPKRIGQGMMFTGNFRDRTVKRQVREESDNTAGLCVTL